MEKIKKDIILKTIENRSYENLNKGNKCFSQNKIANAISYYARAIYLNNKEPIFYFQKAEAYMLIGQTDNAIENYIVCLKKIKNIKEEEKIKKIEEEKKKQEEERKKMLLENEMLLLDKDSKKNEIELNNEKSKELNELSNMYNNIISYDRNLLEKKESHNNSIKSKKNVKKRNNSSATKIKRKKSIKNKKDVVIVKYDRSNKPITSNEEMSNNKNENESESENENEDEDEDENEDEDEDKEENENKNEDEDDDENENKNKIDDGNKNKSINNLQKENICNSTKEKINNSYSNNKLNNEINNSKDNKILKEESINENNDNIKNEHQSTLGASNKNDDDEENNDENDNNEYNGKNNKEKEKKENNIENNTENENKNETKVNKKNKKDKKNKKKKNSTLKLSKKNSIFKKQEEIKEIKTPEKNNPKKLNRKPSKKQIETPLNPSTSKEVDQDEGIIKDEPYCNSSFVSKRLCKALFCSGQLYVDSGIYDEALNCYSKILAIDKNYPHVNLILTCIYIEIQDKEKALYYINECINNENDNANYYVIRAKFYQMNNEVSLVNNDRLKILALSPEHPELEPINKYIINMTTYYKNRADEMVQKEHFDIAVDFLNLAIELDSTDWLLYFKRGLLLCDIEKYEESIKDFEYLLYEIDHDKDKDSIIEEHLSTIYNQYATYTFRNGNLKKAIELLNQGIIYCSSNTVILRNLGDCYLTENKIDKALYEYEMFIDEYKKKKIMTDEEKQEWIEVNRLCGIIISCYASKKYKELKFEESIEKYTEAISYYSFDVNFYIGRAKAYIHLNKFSNAAEDLCVILNLDPENKSAHSLLEQLENNFNTTGNQRIPAFHPQKILKNHPQTTLEAEKIIKERNQKKNEQYNMENKNTNEFINENVNNNKIIKPISSLSKHIKNISDIESNHINNKILDMKNDNSLNLNNINNNNNNDNNNKSPIKYPECYKSLAKQVPSYLVNALFQDIPKEKVNVIKNKLIFSDPESGGIKEKIDTNQELNIKKFKKEIIICDDENGNYETDND